MTRRRLLLLALPLLAITGAALWLRQTHRAIGQSATELKRETEIRFTSGPLQRAPVAFEPIAATASFRDAALLHEQLYVATASSLHELNSEGAIARTFSSGLDLPPAPIMKIAAGLTTASAGRELFLATEGEGLVIFNGTSFRQLRPETPALRKLTSLLPLDTGQILLGTARNGILAWDGNALSVFHPSLSTQSITALAGKLDDLWIGTLDQGLLHLRAGELTRFTTAEGLPDNHILSLAVDSTSAWAGTAMGVARIAAGRLDRTFAPGFFANALLPQQDKLHIGTLEEGIFEIDITARQPRTAPPVAAHTEGRVEKIFLLGGELYALLRDGLYTRAQRGAAWKRITTPQQAPLADANIAALAIEPNGKLWVGYFDRGLDILPPSDSKAIHREDDHLFCVNRILLRKDGAAIATANGLVFTDSSGQTRRVLTRQEGLIASHVTDLAEDTAGLIAATPAGISFLTPSGPQSIYAFHGLVNNHVYTLAQLGPRLLAGTLGGVSVLENGAVAASYTTANSTLRQNWISASAVAANDWFIGTYGAGVYRFDGASWHSFPDLRGQIEINPNAMLATDAAVYAGTLSQGLAIYNRASNRWNFLTTGLPSTNVTAFAYNNGYLYVGTANGLVRIAERNLR
ncbi:MAG: hypothetical protein JST93_05480 [Acidobacteria bacterium]|nr:hypothetical protein [Acidobacteriota bacterium]